MQRTRRAREYAERSLVRLAVAFGDHADQIVVIGGLNADLLTDAPAAPHQGTVDVDLRIQVGFGFERDETDLGWIERGLRDAGLAPSRGDETWRWMQVVDGVPVKVELLCDTPDSRGQQIVLPGCPVATAMNLAGPAAASDGVRRTLTVDARDRAGNPAAGEVDTVTLRFASLGGYVLAKAAAVVGRGLDKDLYDLAFVLIHNRAGGPAQAAEAAFGALPDPAFTNHAGNLRAALDLFVDPGARGSRVYAAQRVLDGETTTEDVLRQDAVGAAVECRTVFDRLAAGGAKS